MIIRGANSAVTRQGGETMIDMDDLLFCMTRRERVGLILMIARYNEDEQRARLKPRGPSSRSAAITPRDKGT